MMSSRFTGIYVPIEGNISDGKTELIKFLIPSLTARGYRVTVIHEDIEGWMKIGIFQKFLEDKKKYAYAFEHHVMHSKLDVYQDMFDKHGKTTDIFISERSVYSDHIFAETLHEEGSIDDTMWPIYEEWYHRNLKKFPMEPDLFLYLQTPADECMKRIIKRSRGDEAKTYTAGYLQNLRVKHDMLFGEKFAQIGDGHYVPCYHLGPAFDISGEKVLLPDYRTDPKIQNAIVDEIEKVLKMVRNARRIGSPGLL